MTRLQRIVSVLGLGLVIAALVNELRTPRGLRAWRGNILGVPYNFRIPGSLDELARTHWNPEGKVIVSQPIGVGWSINIPGLLRRFNLWP